MDNQTAVEIVADALAINPDLFAVEIARTRSDGTRYYRVFTVGMDRKPVILTEPVARLLHAEYGNEKRAMAWPNRPHSLTILATKLTEQTGLPCRLRTL
jgi:hypothetical protein